MLNEPSTLNIHQELELQKSRDEYSKWRASLPVGYLLDRQMELNKKNIIGIDDLEIYEYEKKHIANPIDYYCTRPDVIIRWKL